MQTVDLGARGDGECEVLPAHASMSVGGARSGLAGREEDELLFAERPRDRVVGVGPLAAERRMTGVELCDRARQVFDREAEVVEERHPVIVGRSVFSRRPSTVSPPSTVAPRRHVLESTP